MNDKMREALEAALPYLDNSDSPGGCNGRHKDCGHCAALAKVRAALTPPSRPVTAGADAEKTGLTRTDIRGLIKRHGGGWHGPHVEHLSMEEEAFWRFIFELIMNERRAALSLPPQEPVAAEPAFLNSLRHTARVMKRAHDGGGDRWMSIWAEDLQAVDEAIAALSLPRAERGVE